MENTNWLKIKALAKGSELSDEEIFEELYSLISETGFVTDIETLKKDIELRESKGSTKLTPTLFTPHTKTEGVNHFCSAMLVIPDVMICSMMAWPQDSNFSLTRIAAVLSVANRLSEPSSIKVLGDVADLNSYIDSLLQANGVSSIQLDTNPGN